MCGRSDGSEARCDEARSEVHEARRSSQSASSITALEHIRKREKYDPGPDKIMQGTLEASGLILLILALPCGLS